MKRIITVEEMSRSDEETIKRGLPSLVLMERAALAVVEEIIARGLDTSRVLVVCGTGNNGGDGAAIARLLAEKNINCDILLVGDENKRSAQLIVQLSALSYYNIDKISDIKDGYYSLIVDALFGIGLSREVGGEYADIIDKINGQAAFVLSVDIPSGISGNSGHILGRAVKADLTVTFAKSKIGHHIYPGAYYSGVLAVKEIGIPVERHEGDSCIYSLCDEDLKPLSSRDEFGNKSTFGKLLIIAGSEDICGAAFFAASAALKCGIGMVKILTHEANRSALSVLIPEALIDTYSGSAEAFEKLKSALEWADASVIGPGLGVGELSEFILKRFIENNEKPAVFDADALNIIALNKKICYNINFKCSFTPHVGEMSRLSELDSASIKEEPIKTALQLAQECKAVCILKDAKTVTAYPKGEIFINSSGCSALSTAGSGDVLSGIIGAFYARYRDSELPLEALAVHMHGRLGEEAAADKGASAVTASDLIAAISRLKLI